MLTAGALGCASIAASLPMGLYKGGPISGAVVVRQAVFVEPNQAKVEIPDTGFSLALCLRAPLFDARFVIGDLLSGFDTRRSRFASAGS